MCTQVVEKVLNLTQKDFWANEAHETNLKSAWGLEHFEWPSFCVCVYIYIYIYIYTHTHTRDREDALFTKV